MTLRVNVNVADVTLHLNLVESLPKSGNAHGPHGVLTVNMVAVGVPFSLLGRAAADNTAGVTTHKKGMLSHKEKAQAKKKAKAAGKPPPSSHIEINKLEESFEPKVEAVAVMRHAIHENEVLRKLAKKHHRCRYELEPPGLMHACRVYLPDCCRHAVGQV